MEVLGRGRRKRGDLRRLIVPARWAVINVAAWRRPRSLVARKSWSVRKGAASASVACLEVKWRWRPTERWCSPPRCCPRTLFCGSKQKHKGHRSLKRKSSGRIFDESRTFRDPGRRNWAAPASALSAIWNQLIRVDYSGDSLVSWTTPPYNGRGHSEAIGPGIHADLKCIWKYRDGRGLARGALLMECIVRYREVDRSIEIKGGKKMNRCTHSGVTDLVVIIGREQSRMFNQISHVVELGAFAVGVVELLQPLVASRSRHLPFSRSPLFVTSLPLCPLCSSNCIRYLVDFVRDPCIAGPDRPWRSLALCIKDEGAWEWMMTSA